MENKTVKVNVMIDAVIFRRFMTFDYLYIKRGWKTPAIFALIMLVSAFLCFIMRSPENQAMLLVWVLLVIGLGLPSLHIWAFFSSIKKQITAYKLNKPQQVYSLQFSDEPKGISITNPGGESAQYEWEKAYKVYRVSDCTYFYMIKTKAFILPDKYVEEGPDVLWSLFEDMLPKEKLCDRRKKR